MISVRELERIYLFVSLLLSLELCLSFLIFYSFFFCHFVYCIYELERLHNEYKVLNNYYSFCYVSEPHNSDISKVKLINKK